MREVDSVEDLDGEVERKKKGTADLKDIGKGEGKIGSNEKSIFVEPCRCKMYFVRLVFEG